MKHVALLSIVFGAVVVAGLIMAVLVILKTSSEIIERRQQKKPLLSVENSHISAASLNNLTHAFDDDETKVWWADRRDYVVWVPFAAVMALVAVVLFVLSAYMAARLGTVSYTTHGYNNTPVRHIHLTFIGYLWVLPLLAALVSTFFLWNTYIRWRARVMSLNNKVIRVDFQPWAWAFWLWNDELHDPQPLHRIERVVTEGTILGRVFGYGTVVVATLLQESEPGRTTKETHIIRYVRNYEKVASKIRELVKEAKELMGEGGVKEDKMLETLVDIKGELRRQRPSSSPSPRRR